MSTISEPDCSGTLKGNALALLRMEAAKSVFTWKLWNALRGRPLPPPSQIDLVCEGYPRSGNTFCEHMLRIMAPDMIPFSHTHSAGTIRWAVASQLPVIVIVRDPLEAASSLFLYRNGVASLSICLKEWIAFHEEALRHSEIRYLLFTDLISDTEAAIRHSLEPFPRLQTQVKNTLPDNPSASFEASHDHDKWHLKEVRGKFFTDAQGNRPDQRRSKIKTAVIAAARESRFSDLLNRCQHLLETIRRNTSP